MRNLKIEQYFDVNDHLTVDKDFFIYGNELHEIIIVDNFLKNAKGLVDLLNETEPDLFQKDFKPSHNGVYFRDERHTFNSTKNTKTHDFIKKYIGEDLKFFPWIATNCFKMLSREFNDYKSNYWIPHIDVGYNAIVYLNDYEEAGTNFYVRNEEDICTNHMIYPWRQRKKYTVLKYIKSKFNRLVIFNGEKILHGMAIEDDTFFTERRMNVVIFTTK